MTVYADDPVQQWYATGVYGQLTLAQAILATANAQPGLRVVFHGAAGGHTLPLAEIVDQASRAAAAFRRLGVRPGDAVAVQVPSCVEGVVAQAAALLLGAVLVPVVHIYGPRELGFILRESGARLLVTLDHWAGGITWQICTASATVPICRRSSSSATRRRATRAGRRC
jgi:acyl-CoA synthetase (AMP-forming)/AMP-acid ligase II